MTCEHISFEVGTADTCDYPGAVDRTLLDRVLTDAAQVRPLPEDVAALLREVSAPPRLAAHLRAVHDVAWRLVAAIAELCPALRFESGGGAARRGAATHDIGKTIHTAELSQPGTRHEQAGYELLVAPGVEHRLARFAANHGTWTALDISTEDLLVSLADKIWKAKRVPDLEDRLIQRIYDMTALGAALAYRCSQTAGGPVAQQRVALTLWRWHVHEQACTSTHDATIRSGSSRPPLCSSSRCQRIGPGSVTAGHYQPRGGLGLSMVVRSFCGLHNPAMTDTFSDQIVVQLCRTSR